MSCPVNTVLASAATNGYFAPDPGAMQIIIAQLTCDLKAAIAGGGSGVPTGVIVMWSGTIATIPSGWTLCDGSAGAPDLRDRFIVGARQDDAGVAKTNLTGALTQSGGSISHTHTLTDPGHIHELSYDGTALAGVGQDIIIAPDTGSSVTGITANSASAPQPYFALAYIMKT